MSIFYDDPINEDPTEEELEGNSANNNNENEDGNSDLAEEFQKRARERLEEEAKQKAEQGNGKTSDGSQTSSNSNTQGNGNGTESVQNNTGAEPKNGVEPQGQGPQGSQVQGPNPSGTPSGGVNASGNAVNAGANATTTTASTGGAAGAGASGTAAAGASGTAAAGAGGTAAAGAGGTAAATAGGTAAAGGAAAGLGVVLFWVLVVAIILFILIGIISFLLTMPGVALTKLKQLFGQVKDAVAKFFGGDSTAMIANQDVYNILDYIESMGYDIKGDGYLTEFYGRDYLASDAFIQRVKDDNMGRAKIGYEELPKDTREGYSYENGAIRYGDKIAVADSDFIMTYMMSDNYCYTIKNQNLVTQKEGGNWLEQLWGGIVAVAEKFNRSVANLFGVNTKSASRWGKGMIFLYERTGDALDLDELGEWTDGYTLFKGSKGVELDAGAQTLTIKTTDWFKSTKVEYSLEGWTGRYGMPLEFLLAIHQATRMPDLPMAMVDYFPTTVNLILNKGSVTITAMAVGTKGTLFTQNVIGDGAFDWLSDSNNEALMAVRYGFCAPNCTQIEDHHSTADPKPKVNCCNQTLPEGETIDTVSGGDLDICDNCHEYIDGIVDGLKATERKDVRTYIPFIHSVTDHWYRDVLFVAPEGTHVVNVDDDYELLMDERWTLYETDDNGNTIWYKVDENGKTTNEKWEGTKKEAQEAGVAVARKAITTSLREKFNDEDDAEEFNIKDGWWSAYTFKDSNTSARELAFPDLEDEEDEDDQAYVEGKRQVYYTMNFTTGFPKQVEDGQRTETNNIIKDLFLNKYYLAYNGQGTTAEEIYNLRKEFLSNKSYNTDSEYARAPEGSIYYGPIPDNMIERMLTTTDKGGKILDKENRSYVMTNPNYNAQEEPVSGDDPTAENGNVAHEELNLVDYIGHPAIDAKALEAFTMLEHMHSVDADFIYKDFKELIVELGYFEKEALADNIPELFEFIIPDIGSGGFPKREMDKSEQYEGTLAHSKEDYTINEQNTFAALVSTMTSEIDPALAKEQYFNAVSDLKYETEDGQTIDPTGKANPFTSAAAADTNAVQGASPFTADSETVAKTSFNRPVGAKVKGAARSVESVSIDEFIEVNQEMIDYCMQTGYDYCVLVGDAGDGNQNCNHAPVHGNSCNLPRSFEESKAGGIPTANYCCATLVSWALQNVEVMPNEDHLDGADVLAEYIKNVLGAEVIQVGEPLEVGDIFCYEGHIDYLGNEDSGGLIKFNGGHYCPIGSSLDSDHSASCHQNGWPNDSRIKFALRLPWGGKKKEPKNYEGFMGGEAVVSPVTGILLDYGVYDGSITKETKVIGEGDFANTVEIQHGPDRVNLNKLYPPMGYQSVIVNKNNGKDTEPEQPQAVVETEGEEGKDHIGMTPEDIAETTGGDVVIDKVAYAKIMTLDYTHIQSLENHLAHNIPLAGGASSLVNSEGGFVEADLISPDKIRDWTDDEVSLYGYKEFAELYSKFGLGGTIITIDGFKPEAPVEKDEEEEKKSSSSSDPRAEYTNVSKEPLGDGITLSKSYFASQGKEYKKTRYEPDTIYQLSTEAATNKQNAEATVKKGAYAMMAYGEDEIYIKEGTVLGRTYTNKEFITECRDGESYVDTYDSRKNPDDEDAATFYQKDMDGNYIRVIMTTSDQTTIENVEDYMKLDEVVHDLEITDWLLFYWIPFEGGCTNTTPYQVKVVQRYTGPSSIGTCSEGEVAIGIIQETSLTSNGMCNQRDQFVPFMKKNYPEVYSYIKVMDGKDANWWWQDFNGANQAQKAISACDKDMHDLLLKAEFEEAKEHYYKPLIEQFPWLASKNVAAQAEILHLRVWGADISDLTEKGDKELILYAREKIANTGSTAGPPTRDTQHGRAFNEPEIGLGILEGKLSESDIEEFVKTGDFGIITSHGVKQAGAQTN